MRTFGRLVEHDPRSREYEHPRSMGVLTSVRHPRYVPVTDQGSLGACTGHAGNSVLSSGPCYRSLAARQREALGSTAAVRIYSKATQLDGIEGAYPPTDTGSSGLAACKAMRQLGYIDRYEWTFSLEGALAALVRQPVMLGVSWYSEMNYPAADGQLVAPKGDYVVGGHEVCLDQLDVENRRVWVANSWGKEWGIDGRAWMTWELLSRLLADDGDVAVPIVSGSSLWSRVLRFLGL